MFLVDGYGYLTALSRLGLSGQFDYGDRNLIEKWFHTFKMRVDRFHNSWVGSRASVRELLEQFVHYYNTQRPHQSLNGQRPAEVLNYLTSHLMLVERVEPALNADAPCYVVPVMH